MGQAMSRAMLPLHWAVIHFQMANSLELTSAVHRESTFHGLR